MMTTLRTAAGLLLVAVALTGCSDGGGSGASTADTTEASSLAADDRVAPKNLPEVPQLRQATGAVSGLDLGDCPVEPGKQPVTGTVTGSGKKAQDYVVVINWVNDHSDVRGRAVVVEKDVEPGESRSWEASADVAPGSTQCVPNVRAGRLVG